VKEVTPGLQDAVPAVAGWRGGGLPRALPDGQVAALLAACDRDTATGRRDFGVLTLLARLGLRACEASALELSWHRQPLLFFCLPHRHDREAAATPRFTRPAGHTRPAQRPIGGCRTGLLCLLQIIWLI
jgi:integrase